MCAICRILIALLFPVVALSFTTTTASNGATRSGQLFGRSDVLPSPSAALGKVAVCGATGRTGKLVVDELLDRGIDVVAIVRSAQKAENELPYQDPKVTIVQCDLSSEREIASSIEGCDSVFWCATGFSNGETALIQKLKSMLGIAVAPKKSIGKFQASMDNQNQFNSFLTNTIKRCYWDPSNCQLYATNFRNC